MSLLSPPVLLTVSAEGPRGREPGGPAWVQAVAPCRHQPPQVELGSSAVTQRKLCLVPGAWGRPLLCASMGVSWLQLALPNVKLLQPGFSNNCLRVLSFCGLAPGPRSGGQACFPRLPVQGGAGSMSPGLRPSVGLGPATFQLNDVRPQLPSP